MIGIDIVSIKRISKIRDKYKDKFLEKIFSKDEISLIKKDETLAGFYASKEAISKALKVGIGSQLSFRDIFISKDINGAPTFIITKKIKKQFNFTQSSLSITHDGGFAIAVAVCL
jgi:holo-[acyl-carrier protein] synthase